MARIRAQSPQVGGPPAAPEKSKKTKSYASDGVVDNDVFLLPVSDYQIMLGITILSAVVRLFRIYQPSSVVFDEVQYVIPASIVCWLFQFARANP